MHRCFIICINDKFFKILIELVCLISFILEKKSLKLFFISWMIAIVKITFVKFFFRLITFLLNMIIRLTFNLIAYKILFLTKEWALSETFIENISLRFREFFSITHSWSVFTILTIDIKCFIFILVLFFFIVRLHKIFVCKWFVHCLVVHNRCLQIVEQIAWIISEDNKAW